MHCDHSFLLHLGMDGPIVNLTFQKRLQVQLFDKNSTFLDIRTCPLHTIHNGFSRGIQVIDLDIKQFIVDLNSLFKLTSACREDNPKLEEVTELPPHFSQKHSSTRWVTKKKVTVQIFDQWENSTQYFLKFLPKQPNFKLKNGLQGDKRYQRIKEYLEHSFTQPYISFIAFILQNFGSFLVQFQIDAPWIHLLYPKMELLVFNLMSKFMKRERLYQNIDDLIIVKGIKELLEVDFPLKCNQLSSQTVDVETKSKILLLDESITDTDKTNFRKSCVNFYASTTNYLIQNIPFNVSLIRHAQYVNPTKRTDVKSSNAVSNLALKVGKSLESVPSNVVSLEPHEKVEDLCDNVRAQWKLYQCESDENVTVDEVLLENHESVKETSKVSYWGNAFKTFGLNAPTKLPKHKCIDRYWGKIGSIKDDPGHLKYSVICFG